MTTLYCVGRFFMAYGWIAGLGLIALTIGFGTWGFAATAWDPEGLQPLNTSDALYKAASLLAIQTGGLPTAGNWPLEVARWTGMLFFASALLTFAIRLSRESVHRKLVKYLARDHVIVAGLGETGGRLVAALRAKGRAVVVVERDRGHPALEACRRAGAVVLFGDPADADTLQAARLTRAATLLALFGDEAECVRVVTTAYGLMRAEAATRQRPAVKCVLRLTEPGLLDVIRGHKVKTDPGDRLQLEVLNSYEIAATTMVREAAAASPRGPLRTLAVLGLGTHHRLGEMVVVRAAKDHLITRGGQVEESDKLAVHVFDGEADKWLESALSRYPFLDRVCAITTHPCWARKAGATYFGPEYDAAFVCISDEGHATAQAVMLRAVLRDGQPVMVGVAHSQSGYGALLAAPESGWGANLHAVGLEDALYDPDTATQPEMELRAQTIHHDYRSRQANRAEPANRPWSALAETFRESNRELAERYAAHLASTEGALKTTRYRWEFRADGFTQSDPAKPLLFRFSAGEVESLAGREHFLWKEERERAGWRYGPVKDAGRKTNPLLVDYTQLTNDLDREYNREFVRRIPLILALADYGIVEAT